MRVHLCKTLPFPWYFPYLIPFGAYPSAFQEGLLLPFNKWILRLSEDVAWPRSHSIIKAGTSTSYSSTSCLASLGTEGGDQFDWFDLSFLEVRTIFFERSILSFSIPIFHWDRFFSLLTNLTSCQSSISNSNPFHCFRSYLNTRNWPMLFGIHM